VDEDPILYVGPEDGVTVHLVDKLNEKIKREGWHDDVVRIALINLFGIVGQLEHYVKELKHGPTT
jgi:hypothetical protein